MADVSKKVKFLIFILLISLLINVGIGISSLVGTSSHSISGIGFNEEEQNREQNFSILGVISIPTFMLPYMSIVSLTSLNLPLEIFGVCAIIIGLIETIKTFLYIAIIWNFVPLTNT